MQKRILGHTGMDVSTMGLDVTAFPMPRSRLLRTSAAIEASLASQTLRAAFEMEINLLDLSALSDPYEQEYIGQALEPRRRHFTLIGGIPARWACERYERRTELLIAMLDRLRTNHLDVLALRMDDHEEISGRDLLASDVVHWMEEMIRRGYARFTGLSTASASDGEALVNSDRFDVLLAAYRIVHESLSSPGLSTHMLSQARNLGMGILTNKVPGLPVLEQLVLNMSPDVDPREARRIAVSILFELPHVHAAVLGVQMPEEIEALAEIMPANSVSGAWYAPVNE